MSLSDSTVTLPLIGVNMPWNLSSWLDWHSNNWSHVFYAISAYLISVLIVYKLMLERKPFNLKQPLALWNAGLAVFSALGTYYTGSELISGWTNHGTHHVLCSSSYTQDYLTQFWNWLWTWSKYVEFGDTLFIVLRKKPLTFLHVYHHSLTALCAFLFWHVPVSINRWTISMNYLVHSFMYTYFSLTALGFRLPRILAQMITTVQIAQMFIGLSVNVYNILTYFLGASCNMLPLYALFSLAVYASYSFLFVKMFTSKYGNKRSASKSN